MKIKNKSLQTWAKLLPFLAPYKWQMILIIALMILGACFDMVQPLFSGYAVDNFIEPRTTEGLIPFTAVYLSMVVVQTITTILMAIYALKVEMYLGRDLKRKLFDHLQTLDFSYYNTTPVGTIMARLMSDTGKIGTVLAWSLVDIFWSSMYVLGCVVIMLFVNWKLALILIAIIPIIAVITVVFQKKILAVNRRVRAINAEVTRHYNEGISGAKTSKTLVNLACRFFEPTEGRILIDGKDYRERSMLWLHSSIGYVLQTPHLFSGSVRDNIRYGRLDATDEEIEAAAKLVSAHDAIMHMENGYDSDVGEGGDQLSTGEKQLISFARAVLADPRIFVLDEATASIDTKTEELIQHAISTLLENRTSFLIAHRLSTIRHADLILVVRAGKIIEQGTHEELLQNKGYYADLYNKQFEQENVKHVFGE